MPQTSLARLSKVVWKLLEEYGHDPLPVFLEAGLDPKLINDPDARIRLEVDDKFWCDASGLIDDPCFGLHAIKYWYPSHYGALG
jgi:hypothetical protein